MAAWIGKWLCDRKQKIVLNGEILRLQDVLSGCPNALFLGQYFFIFVKDIDTVIFSHTQKCADDCKVYRSVPTAGDIDILQQDINNLCQWSKDLQMDFNVKKCKVLYIGHNNAY